MHNADIGSISYCEAVTLIGKGEIEGIGPRSGHIKALRLTEPQYKANDKLAKAGLIKERAGSITTAASKEVFREALGDGLFAWSHKANRRLSFA